MSPTHDCKVKLISWLALSAMLAALMVTVISLASAANAYAAYESKWEEHVCSGCYAKDTSSWPNGGYHTWEVAGAERYGEPVQPKLCIWLYNGSKWEAYSGCTKEQRRVAAIFPARENALAQAQGWAYNGGFLTMVGDAVA